MQIPVLGQVTKDERFGWFYSLPFPLSALENRKVRIVLEGYEEDESKDDFHSAISAFLSIGASVLKAAEPHVFSYYQDVNGYWTSSDEEYVSIKSPSEVWSHVEFGEEAFVSRRHSGDKGIYVSIECNCDWEPEHGLQIVFKDGKSISKVGPYDGHLTNSDAYADERLENVVYRPIG